MCINKVSNSVKLYTYKTHYLCEIFNEIDYSSTAGSRKPPDYDPPDTEDDDTPPWDESDPRKVWEALRGLRDHYRTILSPYYIEGYDYYEIASIMNTNYGRAHTKTPPFLYL